ncbi:MAG: Nucleotidyl transferase involved in threonylcarbamoyladenosine formation [Labilithrix sp.]|nr:Nucleotidyl transferase involved in threonylcarbamoyladenosine formation [Labilithrix sp.]
MTGLPCMILGAGLGSRLRPLTGERAKPMVPIGDAPAVAHVLARVRLAAGRVVVNVHHRPEDLARWAEEQDVGVSHEPVLLGTAGGIHAAAALLGEGDVLVWNGDILSDLDPRTLVEAHARDGSAATLAVLPRPAGEGTVGIDAAGRVVRLRGRRSGDEVRGGEFLGIHVLGERLRHRLPAEGCLVGDVYLPALAAGETIRACEVSASFRDVGTVAEYLAANRAWLEARSLSSWAHPTADVRADIRGSVVGAYAIVTAPARSSVVWPNAYVQNACEGVVVTPAAPR